MQMLDAMQVGQGKGKPFSLCGCDEHIDVDRMNGLIALLIATTVAKRLPASGQTGEKDVSHDGHSWCRAAAGREPSISGAIGLLDVNGLLYSSLRVVIVADTAAVVNKVNGLFPMA
jgi:hypothetical protein